MPDEAAGETHKTLADLPVELDARFKAMVFRVPQLRRHSEPPVPARELPELAVTVARGFDWHAGSVE